MGSIVMEPDDISSYAKIYHPARNRSSICLSLGKIQSNGLFKNNNPFDYSVPLLLMQLSFASMFILFTSRLLKPLGQPTIVIQILGGMALGPSFLGRINAFTELLYPLKGLVILDSLAIFGYIFYFFLIGVQMDPWLLKKMEKKELIIGISNVVFAGALSLPAAFITLAGNKFNLEPRLVSSLPYAAAASSLLAFPGVAHYLTELKMANSQFGKTALSSSLISNMFSFCIVSITFMANQQFSGRLRWVQTLAASVALAAIIFFVVRPLIVSALQRQPDGEPLKQGFISMILVGVLMTAFCSKAIGLSIFMGPLMFGIAVPAGPPLGSTLMEKLDFVTSWLFMPLYFVKTGLVLDIFSVRIRSYLVLQSIILLGCLGKFLGPLISSLYFKMTLRDAISIGLIMNVQGLMDLAMFKSVKQSKAINEEAFVILCMSMLIVTASISPLLRYLYDPSRRYAVCKRRTVLHLKPNSILKVLACIHHQENVPSTVHLLEALNPNRRSPIEVCLLHLVELVGRANPLFIPHKLAKSHYGNPSTSKSIINAFKNFQQNYFTVVNMQSFTSISPYASMHDVVCLTAIERRISLILVPFHKQFSAGNKVEVRKQGIKTVNDNILEMAPCSVAMIVDRGQAKTSRTLLESRSSYRVAVLFLGGSDDREAIAIGARMAGQPNVTITILRLLGNANNTQSDNREMNLDDDVVNMTRSLIAGNIRATYMEETVKDGIGTVAVLRNMENLYELIIVGRRHDTQSPLLQGFAEWNEESELGTLGNILASAEINRNSTILVVQQRTTIFDPNEERGNNVQFKFSQHIRRATNFRTQVVLGSNGRPYFGI